MKVLLATVFAGLWLTLCCFGASDESGETPAPVAPADFERPVSWWKLFPNFLSDQKRIWQFPVNLAEGQHVLPSAAFLAGTAGLVALDPLDAAYFRRTRAFRRFNHVFSNRSTAIGMGLVPVSLYLLGSARDDSKMQKTALFAIEAVANAELLTTVLKDIDRRATPMEVPAGTSLANSWFKPCRRSVLYGSGVFPSGHTIAAFSLATVAAQRYKDHRWVPYAAYGMAALVGFSRVTLNGHFVSDVVAGGVLGYSISRFTVLRQ